MPDILRAAVASLLLLHAAAASAEWVKAGEVEDGAAIVYVDPASVKRSGGNSETARLWVLRDYRAVRTVGRDHALSAKEQWEIDCKGYQARMLEFSWMSEKMGAGSVVIANRDGGNWRLVAPATVVEMLWKTACAKK